MGAFEGDGFHLDEQFWTGQAGDAAAHGDRTTIGEPRWSLAIRAIHLGAVYREGAAPDDVV
jgi:hypothetical protein